MIAAGCIWAFAAAGNSYALFRSSVDAEQERLAEAQAGEINPVEVLDLVTKRMEAAHKWLQKSVTGEPTTKEQAQAIALLDQLIDSLKDPQQDQPEPPPEVDEAPTGGDKPPTGDEPPKGGDKPPTGDGPPVPPIPVPVDKPTGGTPTGARNSFLPPDGSTPTPAQLAEAFGQGWDVRLPKSELEKVIKRWADEYPDRYRDLLAEYFKQLNER